LADIWNLSAQHFQVKTIVGSWLVGRFHSMSVGQIPKFRGNLFVLKLVPAPQRRVAHVPSSSQQAADNPFT
jgi:hypothetical protein